MMRRVLIVTSSYVPAMIADMHRARHLAWELPRIDWRVEILCPDGSYQQPSCMDEDSTDFFSRNAITHFVPQYFAKIFRLLGFGNIGWRAVLPMLLAGRRLLRQREFDVVYISTTQFPLFLLGPAWQRCLGVPYILDLHDPCYKEDTVSPIWARPSLKHTFSHWLAKQIESLTVPAAAGLIAVSPAYIQTLSLRYASKKPRWLEEGRQAVIPFSALQCEFDEAARKQTESTDPIRGQQIRIIYVGAGGPIMRRSFLFLCRVLAYLREDDPKSVNKIRFDLFGTVLGWHDGDQRLLMDLARDEGIAELVCEDPRRVSYRKSVQLLLESDGVLILGVDDPGYMPSKLFSYAVSGKPVLAVIRRDSAAFAYFQSAPRLGHAIWFDKTGEMPVVDAAQTVDNFLREAIARMTFERQTEVEYFMAPSMARRHAELFEACLQQDVSPAVR